MLNMIVIKIFIMLALLMLTIMFYTLWERRFIGFVQDRLGPNRVGFCGLLQPIADAIKLLVKSMVIPNKANKFLFILGPIIAVITALSAWAVIPVNQTLVLANINVGVLYILAITSLSVYGIVIAGWASNSNTKNNISKISLMSFSISVNPMSSVISHILNMPSSIKLAL